MRVAGVAAVLLLACLAGAADARQLLQGQCASCVGGHPDPDLLVLLARCFLFLADFSGVPTSDIVCGGGTRMIRFTFGVCAGVGTYISFAVGRGLLHD